MQKTQFGNGFTVFTENIENAKTVTFSIYIKAGSYQETDHLGIAHFLEHMVFKGTEKRNARQIIEEVEDVGGFINAETTYEYTRYYATTLAENWKVGADVISDIVLNATFPDKEVELERKVIQEELKMYSDDSSSHVYDMLIEAMHKSYKNRQLIGGTVQTVADIDRDALIEFRNKFYQPNNMFAVVTGNIKHEEVVDFLKELFGAKGNNLALNQNNAIFKPDILNSETVKLERNVEQAHLCWGLFGPSVNDDDYYAVEVACTILGGNSSSRLYQIIREERGLAYTVSVDYMGLKDNGIIIGYAGLEKSVVDEVKDIVIEEFEKLRTEYVSDKELNRAISGAKFSNVKRFENPSSINGHIGGSIIQGTSTDPEDFIKGIESVTKEDIMRIAKKYFNPDNWQFAEILPR